MDYVPPYDQIGITPPGPWQNANPDLGVEGSIPNAIVFAATQAEILKVQDEAGLTRNGSDYTQLLQAIRSGKLVAFADTGTADALVVTPTTPYTALPLGAEIGVLKGTSANATVAPTLKISSLTFTIVKEDGTPLAKGDLPAGCLFTVKSDAAPFASLACVRAMLLLRQRPAPPSLLPLRLTSANSPPPARPSSPRSPRTSSTPISRAAATRTR